MPMQCTRPWRRPVQAKCLSACKSQRAAKLPTRMTQVQGIPAFMRRDAASSYMTYSCHGNKATLRLTNAMAASQCMSSSVIGE